MKKICFINPGINIKRPIAAIVTLLNSKNYAVHILSPKNRDRRKKKRTRHYEDFSNQILVTYPVKTNNIDFGWPIPNSLEFFKKAWHMLKTQDIIHMWVPFYPSTFTISLLKLLFFRKKTLILTMDTFPGHSFELSSMLDPLFKIFYKTLGVLAYAAANYVTIYGKSLKKYALKAGIPEKKLLITPTGIDLKIKKPNKDIRKELKIPEEKKIILYIGIHNIRKGLDIIYQVANILRQEDVIFVMVGDGAKRSKLQKAVQKAGLTKNFRFTGTRLDVHNFYAQADIFILPSRGEGLAGVLMEAMKYKVPIVTSNIPGTQDIITDMENGILCDIEDANCYAKAIRKILNEKFLQEKFRKNGIKKIKNTFLWKNNIKKFEKIYESIPSVRENFSKSTLKRKDKIKVLRLISSASGGGAQTGLLRYTAHYDNEQFDLSVCTLRKGTGNFHRKFKRIGKGNYFTLDLKKRVSIKAVIQLHKFINENKIDILHTHLIEADLYGFILKLLNPSLILIAGRHGQNLFRKSLVSGMINYISSIPANQIVSVSKGLKDFIHDYEFIPKSKINVVYNGINLEFFKPIENKQFKEKILSELMDRKIQDEFVIGIVGRLKRLKGHDFLFEAVKILKEKGYNNLIVLVLGEGKHLKRLKKLRDDLGLKNNIFFLGFQQKIVDFYNIFDILCLPSNYEGLSNVIIEAMACETLVVCSDIKNNLEIISSGYDGLAFKKEDSIDLAEKIEMVIQQKIDVQEITQNARKTVKRRFNIIKNTKKLEILYKFLIWK